MKQRKYEQPTEFHRPQIPYGRSPQESRIPYSNQRIDFGTCHQDITNEYEQMGSTLIPTLASCGILGLIGCGVGCLCYKCRQKKHQKNVEKFGDGSYNYPFNIDAMNGDFDFISQNNLWKERLKEPREIYIKKEE